jgi:flagellar export protein FliJ
VQRIRRAERLLELAERGLKTAQTAAAAAEQLVDNARATVEAHEREWELAAQTFGTGVATATDLQNQALRLQTLRVHADAAARNLAVALDGQRKAQASVLDASRKKRTMELWRDRIREANQEEQRTQEQRGFDELAARVVRARS